MPPASEYTTEDIQVLEGIAAVRKRPGMYLGDVTDGSALLHTLWEIIDNAVDEHLAGYGNEIEIELRDDGSVRVSDQGRGIPTEPTERGVSIVEACFTVLHTGSKFNNKTFAITAGRHGVGVSAVNAVSAWLEVEVRREGKVWQQRFERGKPTGPLRIVGDTSLTGTTVVYLPDPEIFPVDLRLDPGRVHERLTNLAACIPGLSFLFRCERHIRAPGGIASLVEAKAERPWRLPSVVKAEGATDFRGSNSEGVLRVNVALQWSDRSWQEEKILSFVNNQVTLGGSHVIGFSAGLTKAFELECKRRGMKQDATRRRGLATRVRRGLVACIQVQHPEPSYGSRTKDMLRCKVTQQFVQQFTMTHVRALLAGNPGLLEALVAD